MERASSFKLQAALWGRSACGLLLAAQGLVAEMAHAGEDHGNAGFVGCVNHFLIAHGAAGLDNCADAHLGGVVDAVAEREEGV